MVLTKMSGQTTSSPVTVPDIIFVLLKSWLHILTGANIIRGMVTRAENIISNIWSATINSLSDEVSYSIISGDHRVDLLQGSDWCKIQALGALHG